MALTAAEANQLLLDNPLDYVTKESFLNLVRQLSVDATGEITVLYGQPVATNQYGASVAAGDLVKELVKAGTDVRVIDTTEAAKFLEIFDPVSANQVLIDFLRTNFGDPFVRDGAAIANHLLFDATPDEGAWATSSKNFADATVGEVLTFTPNATMTRVFGATELLSILDNPSSQVSRINGTCQP